MRGLGPAPGYLSGIREIADSERVPLVFDEGDHGIPARAGRRAGILRRRRGPHRPGQGSRCRGAHGRRRGSGDAHGVAADPAVRTASGFWARAAPTVTRWRPPARLRSCGSSPDRGPTSTSTGWGRAPCRPARGAVLPARPRSAVRQRRPGHRVLLRRGAVSRLCLGAGIRSAREGERSPRVLRSRGVFGGGGRYYVSLSHGEAEIDVVVSAVEDVLRELART